MALGYHISQEDGLVTIRGEGRATFDELAQLGQQLIGDPDYDDGMPQLIDLRGLRIAAGGIAAGGTLDALRAFVQRHYRQRVNASVAVVIDDRLERRHAATIFRLTCEIGDAELFSDYGLAIRWLMRQAFAPAHYPRWSGKQHHTGRENAQRAPE